MEGVSRKELDDVASGLLTDPPEQYNDEFDFCYAEGYAIAVEDQSVSAHPPCGQPGGSAHCTATMSEYSSVVFIAGQGVVRNGDSATCGHTAVGSNVVFAA